MCVDIFFVALIFYDFFLVSPFVFKMSKDNKTFEKLRQFFRMKKGGDGLLALQQREEFHLTPEIEREIAPSENNTIQSRIKKLREISEHVLYSHLDSLYIVKLFDHITDLLKPEVPKESRCVAFQFMRCIIRGQYDQITFMRRKFFLVIRNHDILEDLVQRLELLQTLTQDGIDILHFESDIVKFMMEWMKTVVDNNQTMMFLGILVNIIKYNAAHIDDDVLSLLVCNVCYIVLYKEQTLIPRCLDIFDAVICYCTMPPEVLPTFTRTFCLLINWHAFSTTCWKIMKNVLGTHMGHSSVFIMCNLLQIDPDSQEKHNINYLRGSLFSVSQAKWGAKEYPNVKVTLSSILTYMNSALQCNHPFCDHSIVVLEAANCLHTLFMRQGAKLTLPEWDCVLEVIESVVNHLENKQNKVMDAAAANLVKVALQECLVDIEQLVEAKNFSGSERRFFVIVERCSSMIPESSVLRLINYLVKAIEPIAPNWLDKLDSFIETYFKHDTRSNVRIKALECFGTIYDYNCRHSENEILDILCKQFKNVHRDSDPNVRAAVAKLLIKLCSAVQSSDYCIKLMEIIHKLLLRPYSICDPPPALSEIEAQDIKIIVEGLVNYFAAQLYNMPCINAINAFAILNAHLEMHYKKPRVLEKVANIRRKIFDCFLRIRVCGTYNVGYHDPPGKLKFSPFLLIDFMDNATAPTINIAEIRWRDENVPCDTGSMSSNNQTMSSLSLAGRGGGEKLTITDPSIAQIVRETTTLKIEESDATEKETDDEDEDGDSEMILDRVSWKKKFTITIPQMTPALPSQPKYPLSYISLSPAVRNIVTALRRDLDWTIVSYLLQELPNSLKNRALVLTRYNNDIDNLAAALCSMVVVSQNDRRGVPQPDTYCNTPARFSRLELHCHVFPVLASLASYHAHLAPNNQQRIIKCLEFGAIKVTTEGEIAYSRREKCITALATCSLEMEREMIKLLPEVLLNLSKITITSSSIAIPILGFVSMLTRLPKLFANFVGDQYMSVFAICMPCTNPFKYNHYTVSLAHHVITVWFLKCRFNFRRDFVRFITNQLKANSITPFEEGGINMLGRSPTSNLVNEDSTNRKRSSSLTEQGSKHRAAGASAARNSAAIDLMRPPIDGELMALHQELTETLIDLMARYTYSTLSPVSKRLPLTELILAGGPCTTWIVGNKLISITTSACAQKPLRDQSVCEKCYELCWPTSEMDTSLDATSSLLDPQQKSPLTTSSSNDSGLVGSKTAPVSTVNSPGENDDKKFSEPFQCDPSEWSKLDQLAYGPDRNDKLCQCWCQSWAEIHVRRPAGDMSWVARIQNRPYSENTSSHADLIKLFLPSQKDDIETEKLVRLLADISEQISEEKVTNVSIASQIKEKLKDLQTIVIESSKKADEESGAGVRPMSEPVSIPCSPIRRTFQQSGAQDNLEDYDDYEDYEGTGRNRNPVRRSNSSPEMSGNYKNPFLKQALDKQDDSDPMDSKKKKDLRGNCEAIPEEIAGQGTTPPTNVPTNTSSSGHISREPTIDKYGPDDDPLLLLSLPSEKEGQPKHAPVSKQLSLHQPLSIAHQPSLTTTSITQQTSILRQQSSSSSSVSEGHYPATRSSSDASNVSDDSRKSGDSNKYTKCIPDKSASTSNLTFSQTSLVTTKPPISATTSQLSPRSQSRLRDGDPSTLPPLRRDRGHTISVMSPALRGKHFQKADLELGKRSMANNLRNSREPLRYGSNPSSMFLSLYHNPQFGNNAEKPILVSSEQGKRGISNLDWIPPFETHKVGVLYVGPNQTTETEILRNQYGSVRYNDFLKRLGTLIKLTDANPLNVFLGGLETNGSDGKYTFCWQDEVMQVIFHVATMMPTLETDPNCNNKKKNIGNDHVTIVYNESGLEYNFKTVKGQFNYAVVIVEPLEHGVCQITVKSRDELVKHIGHTDPKTVSDQNGAIMARQLALHANFASLILCSLNTNSAKKSPYASNYLERLRQIKRIKEKIQEKERLSEGSASTNGDQHRGNGPNKLIVEDFTEYTT